jgi:subtilisin family serine protease
MSSKQRSILRYGLSGWVLLWVWVCSSPLVWANGKMGSVLQRAVVAGSDAERLNAIPGVFYRGNTPHVRLLLKLSDIPPELEQAGVELKRRSGDVYTATAPLERLMDVEALPEIIRMEAVQRGKPLLETSVPDIFANEVWTNRKWGNQGEGVLVGMVDTGILYQHEAFLDEEGNSRILYILDNATDPATECDTASILDETCTETDGDGHGTAVMGVIAGAGSDECEGNTDVCEGRGVAPRANIVAVASPELWSDEVIEGVAYIFDKAQELGMPAIVNLSIGFFSGPRDGTSLLEQAISNQAGPGKIVVASAGNEADTQGHAEASVNQGSDDFVFSVVGPGAPLGLGEIEGWYDAREGDPNDMEVRVLAFTQAATDWIEFGEFQNDVEAPAPYSGTISVDHRLIEEAKTTRGFLVTLEDAQQIEWRIQIRKTGSGQKDIDLWINPMTFPEPGTGELPKFRFTREHEEEWARTTLTPPCTAENVICVASYNTDCDVPDFCTGVGETEQTISSFSSQGPRRDGRIGWPWISAPGQAILTAYISGEDDYDYWAGTSFSSPHVAGTVALMFGASPDTALSYSVGEIKDFLKDSAREAGDRDVWGWGKLNTSAAVSELFSTLPPPPPPVPHGLGGDDDICFIATAAFGDIDAPQVRLLREMRDRCLLKTELGRRFVRFYYRWSPPVAAWLKEHAVASRLVRASLLPAVGWSEMVYHRSPRERAILFGLGLSLISAVCYFSVRRRTR